MLSSRRSGGLRNSQISTSVPLVACILNKAHTEEGRHIFSSSMWLFWCCCNENKVVPICADYIFSMAFLSPQSVAHHLFIYTVCSDFLSISSSFHSLSQWSCLISFCSHSGHSPAFQLCPISFQFLHYIPVFLPHSANSSTHLIYLHLRYQIEIDWLTAQVYIN